jgi:hypothetical protein
MKKKRGEIFRAAGKVCTICSRGFHLAWRGARTYGWTMLAIQAVTGFLLTAYYTSPAFRLFCDWLAEQKERGGLYFASLASVIACGIIPESIKARMRPPEIKPPTHADLLHVFALFAITGAMANAFYRIQSKLFGNGTDAWTLARKIAMDQLAYTPFIVLPLIVLWFFWRECGFRPLATLRTCRLQTIASRVGEIMPVNLIYWIPILCCVYSLPEPLQYLLALLAASAWSILIIFMVRRQSEPRI